MDEYAPEKEISHKEQPGPGTRLDRIVTMAPVKICLFYLVLGVLWIIFSDQLLLSLPLPREYIILISQAKGTLFIVVTAILLFLLIRHYTRRWQEKNEDLMVANANLTAREEELKSRYDEIARSHAEWVTTYNAISDWVSVISPDGRILKTNRSIESLFGVSPEHAIGRHCFGFVHGSTCPIVDCPRLRMIVSKKRERAEIQTPQRNGWFLITVDPVFDSTGNVVSAVHVVREITERMQEQKALEQAKKKLHLLNYVTFNEIQNAVFTLWGFQQFIKDRAKEDSLRSAFAKEDELLSRISQSLKFAQAYQNLGLRPPLWQDVSRVFLMAISHLDFLTLKRTIELDGIEIFADPMLEQVLMILADNTLVHGKKATQVTLRYSEGQQGVTLFFEDDGVGIPAAIKSNIFSPDFQKTKAIGLFLAQEILEITNIVIQETGTPGNGVSFEIIVPKGAYRFPGRK